MNLLVHSKPWDRHWSERPWRGGIKFLDDDEWQARKHGVRGRRQWRKVHLVMDAATPEFRAVEFTPSSAGDSPVLPKLRDQIPAGEEIGTVTADGAYDTPSGHRDRSYPQERERTALP